MVDSLRTEAVRCVSRKAAGGSCGTGVTATTPVPTTSGTTTAPTPTTTPSGVATSRHDDRLLAPSAQGRNVELSLLLLAVGIVVIAYLNVGLATQGSFPGLLAHGTGLLVISLAFHMLLRWRASYADPLLLPIVTLLNGSAW